MCVRSARLVMGFGHRASLTIPMSAEQAIIYPVVGIGGFVLAGMMVALSSVITHLLDEADRAPTRLARIHALEQERTRLDLTLGRP